MAPVSGLPTTHFEVVDDRNALVGAMKHKTVEQALQMKAALAALPDVGPLDVALVTETIVVQRHVERIVDNPAAIMRGARKIAA